MMCSLLLSGFVLLSAVQFGCSTDTKTAVPETFDVYVTGFMLNESFMPVSYIKDFGDTKSKEYITMKNGIEKWCTETFKASSKFKDTVKSCGLFAVENAGGFTFTSLVVAFSTDKIHVDLNNCLQFTEMTNILLALMDGKATKYNLCYASDVTYPKQKEVTIEWFVKVSGQVVNETGFAVKYLDAFSIKDSKEYKDLEARVTKWMLRILSKTYSEKVKLAKVSKDKDGQTIVELLVTLKSKAMPTLYDSRCISDSWAYFILNLLQDNVKIEKNEYGLQNPGYVDV